MGQDSKIEWCDHTFNPWIGCTKVSAGCSNCYAEHLMDKRYGRVQWGPQGERVRTSAQNWRLPLRWNKEAAERGVRYRVFCASLADLFENNEAQCWDLDEWRTDLWRLIRDTPNLDWLLLTKRPENVLEFVPLIWWDRHVCPNAEWPDNVWIGASIEDQDTANERIRHLLKIPAPRRFLSCEPMLGLIDIWDSVIGARKEAELEWRTFKNSKDNNQWLHWVIVGGESGRSARPMHPDWVRSIRDQCAGVVPFFFKQWGEWVPAGQSRDVSLQVGDTLQRHLFGHKEGAVLMHKAGKKRTGRRLDGVEHNEIPESVTAEEHYG